MNTPQGGSLTGDAVVDRTVRGFLELVTLLFPERVRACYLTGSWSDGTAVRVPGESLNSSDVDLSVVFKIVAPTGHEYAARLQSGRISHVLYLEPRSAKGS